MSFVLITQRLVKVNTGTTERYSPRTANRTMLTVSGPFGSIRQAQRAAIAAIATHTILAAQVWSESQVRGMAERGYGGNGPDLQIVLADALRLLEAGEAVAHD
jgi:hypothetical protein